LRALRRELAEAGGGHDDASMRGPTMTDTLVPFGKYKGQPIDVLREDKSYCDWLAGQDWFRDRYTTIHTLIVNNFREPSETPEHNALQARFLDNDWLERFITARVSQNQLRRIVRALYDTPLAHYGEMLGSCRTQLANQQQRDLVAEWETETTRRRDDIAYQAQHPLPYVDNRPEIAKRRAELTQRLATRTDHLAQQTAERAQRLEQLQAVIAELEPQIAALTAQRTTADYWFEFFTEFEVGGADVELTTLLSPAVTSLERWQKRFPVGGFCLPEKATDLFSLEREFTHRIECKPSLGDDYPAVLRQMRAAKTNSLVIGAYAGTGATLEQVREVFGEIKILTVAEILAVSLASDTSEPSTTGGER
jgi:hypothetical protein